MVSKRNAARRRPRTAQRRAARRAPRRRQSQRGDVRSAGTKPSVGKIIARGVKELVSSVPVIGPILGSLADVTFQSFGLSRRDLYAYGPGSTIPSTAGDVAICRMYTRFDVFPAALLVGSKVALPSDTNRAVTTTFVDGRVISLTVTLRPSSAVLTRQGEWHLSIQPYFNVTDYDQSGDPNINQPGGISSQYPPYEEAMRRNYLSTSGPASQPLALTYKPRVQDGRAYQYNRMDSRFCHVSILYTQYIRDAYTTFPASEFAPEILISGSVELRGSDSGGTHANTVTYPKEGFTWTKMVEDYYSGNQSYPKAGFAFTYQTSGVEQAQGLIIMDPSNTKLEVIEADPSTGTPALMKVSGNIKVNTKYRSKQQLANEFEYMSIPSD